MSTRPTSPPTSRPAAQERAECHDDACITCADQAVAVRVVELRPGGLALVETGAGREEVSVALVEARVGDVVLVHAKEAIGLLGSDESRTS
jgi:hydrogenase maturation factor